MSSLRVNILGCSSLGRSHRSHLWISRWVPHRIGHRIFAWAVAFLCRLVTDHLSLTFPLGLWFDSELGDFLLTATDEELTQIAHLHLLPIALLLLLLGGILEQLQSPCWLLGALELLFEGFFPE